MHLNRTVICRLYRFFGPSCESRTANVNIKDMQLFASERYTATRQFVYLRTDSRDSWNKLAKSLSVTILVQFEAMTS